MRILHVVPSFFPAVGYGGPIRSVYGLCQHLAAEGHAVRVLTTNANGPHSVLDVGGAEQKLSARLRVRYCRRLAPDAVAPGMIAALPGYVRWADVVHLHAVYSFPTMPTLATCRLLRKPLVWSPRGAFQRWQSATRPAAKKLWEGICRMLRGHVVLHATSLSEKDASVARTGIREAWVTPNGVDVPAEVRRHPRTEILRLLCLGRLHPIKGLENLLLALGVLPSELRDRVELTLAGDGEPAYVERLRGQVAVLDLRSRVRFLGHVEGQEKVRAFQEADVLVCPSHVESFGIAVAEALANGVPVIASRGTPWDSVEELGCGLWVDNAPAALAAAIEKIDRMPLGPMGQRGRDWVAREFEWPVVTKAMIDHYRVLVAGEPSAS